MKSAATRGSGWVSLFLVLVSSVTLLEGCKGKGKQNGHDRPAHTSGSGSPGSGSAPATQQPPATPQGLSASSSIKTLNFTWSALSNVDYYRLLENADGSSGYSQKGANITATAYSFGIADHFFNWPNAKYMLEACNSQGCSQTGEIAVSGAMLGAIGYFKPDLTPANIDNYYGMSIALSADGNTLAVGVPGDDSSATGIDGDTGGAARTNSGAVYVYARQAGTWQKQAYIKASNAEANDSFGISVSLSTDGNTLAVGASGESSNAQNVNGDQNSNTADAAGAAYVFKRSNNSWTQQAYLKASNTEAFDGFGVMLALSGDAQTLAVGALGEDSSAAGINGNQSNNSQFTSGAVYVFVQDNNAWAPQAYIKASNPGSGDRFGNSLALSDNGATLAVAAYWEGSNATGIDGNQLNELAHYSGAVYVFNRSNAVWSQQAYIKASNSRAHAHFGVSLSLAGDGDTLAVSAFQEGSNATGVDGDQSNTLAGGSGAVYVFARDVSSWAQQSYIKASNTEANDRFGYNIKLSADGAALAVGATDEDSAGTGLSASQSDNTASGAGAVYVFSKTVSSWQQSAYVKAPNTDAADEFGRTVALSADGQVLAVSAVGEASNTTGINGDQSDNSLGHAGAVYLY